MIDIFSKLTLTGERKWTYTFRSQKRRCKTTIFSWARRTKSILCRSKSSSHMINSTIQRTVTSQVFLSGMIRSTPRIRGGFIQPWIFWETSADSTPRCFLSATCWYAFSITACSYRPFWKRYTKLRITNYKRKPQKLSELYLITKWQILIKKITLNLSPLRGIRLRWSLEMINLISRKLKYLIPS